MTLYEIDQRIESLVDPDTGELFDYEAFMDLQMERVAKIENMALWAKEMAAQAAAIKAEIDTLSERRRVLTAKQERLKTYIARVLDGERFETARCSVSFRRSTSLDVTSAHDAAVWLNKNGYMDMVTYDEPKLDKRSVKKLVEDGKTIPGVEIVTKQSVQVR